jgi:type VI secretion system protein
MMTLTVTNNISTPGLKNPVAMDTGRLTIGRGPDNGWVLPDPRKVISRHHCVIEEYHGQYRLLDISNNGVFIGDVNRSVGQGNSYLLCQDDLILIGDYIIAVAFEPASPMETTDPLPTLIRPEKSWMPVNPLAGQPSKPGPDAPEEDQQALQSEMLSDATCPVPAEGDMSLAVREVLLGAGLDPDDVLIRDPAETLRLVGEALRIVVAGVVDLLKARAAVKCEFGVEQTQIRAVKNNPLKFSLSVEDTLKMLLGGPRQGYLETSAAFEETFTDLKVHQMAVLAGTQEAWHDLFKRFDPQALEQRIGEDRGLQGLLGSKKVRCWDAFTLLYQTLLEDAEDSRESLLVRKFAKAYGEQMGRAGRRVS